jgi:hypothetical protein
LFGEIVWFETLVFHDHGFYVLDVVDIPLDQVKWVFFIIRLFKNLTEWLVEALVPFSELGTVYFLWYNVKSVFIDKLIT